MVSPVSVRHLVVSYCKMRCHMLRLDPYIHSPTQCTPENLSISGGIEMVSYKKCCEGQGIKNGTKLSGALNANIGIDCLAGINVPNVAQFGGYINIGGSCGLSAGGNADICSNNCGWSIGGTCSSSISGGLRLEVISKDVIDGRVGLNVGGQLGYSADCNKTEYKGCIGPATASGYVVLARFQKKSVTYVFPKSTIWAKIKRVSP